MVLNMAFGKSSDEPRQEDTGIRTVYPSGQKNIAFLGQGSKVVGTLQFSGPVEVDGHVEGELNADKLVIGESATVNAKITGGEIIIKGTVTGDIVASKKLTLQRPAKVHGNITSTNLSIEEGVIFEGQCSMATTSGNQKSGVASIASQKVAV